MSVNTSALLSDDIRRPAPAVAVFSFPGGGMQRCGAPARKEAARHPNGRLVHHTEADQGTPELQARRARLSRGSDPKLASYALGRLYAHRIVLQGDRWAGDRYATLFTLAVRPVTIASMLGNLVAGGMLPQALALLADGASEDFAAEARSQYLAARELLTPLEARAVDAICVYDDEGLELGIIAGRAKKSLEHLTGGLHKLHRHFEDSDRQSKAAKQAAD